jgi:hypothetical protein
VPPWHENLGKRQVTPKVYLRDSGLLHSLLRLASRDEVLGHPKLGASWEGFALESLLSHLATRDAYFWATHGGAELDLQGFPISTAGLPIAGSRSRRSGWSAIGKAVEGQE